MEIANDKTTPQACKELQIIVQTYYRWRKEYCTGRHEFAGRIIEAFRFSKFHDAFNWPAEGPEQ